MRIAHRHCVWLITAAALSLAAAAVTVAEAAEQAHVCRYCDAARLRQLAIPAGEPAPNGRQYSPDRHVDVEHVKIDVTPSFEKRTVSGVTTVRFKPIAVPVRTIRLHAVDLTIHAVNATHDIEGYHVEQDALIVTFKKKIAPGKPVEVTVMHTAEPDRGLYFRTPAMGYREGDTHLWTQGEPHEARHWFPSFDYPNERFTSEVICRVPPDMTAISNGRLVSEKVDDKTGLKAVHWLQDKPHVNYLIALTAGYFKSIEEKHGDIPLRFFTPPSQIDAARNSFRNTADMMVFFEKELGVKYPWDKYDQVVVDDFNWGGMENTTLTILTDRTLFTDAFETARSSQNLVAHELIHQWFGDLITCQDWSHLWLNEGFATYYAHLYAEHHDGRDHLLYGLYRDARRITGNKNERRPIVYRGYTQPWEQFDHRAYQKGSWVLHMLRTKLGPELYRKCVTRYLKQNAQRSAVTEDLVRAFQEESGLSLQQFFDQWVYHARHPELTVKKSWDETTKLAKVSVTQTQKVDEAVLLFSFPVTLKFVTDKGDVIEHDVIVREKEHDFFVKLPSKPRIVRFDANFGVLAEVTFDKSAAMFYAQLKDESDVVGRLLAVEALSKRDDKRTVAALTDALRGDPFYGVRVEAAKALRQIHTDDAFDALAGSLDQPDARAREQVAREIAAWFEPRAKSVLLEIARTEKNPDVRADAIRGLGLYHGDDTRATLTELLRSDSYKNVLADAAIAAIRKLDDPAMIGPLTAALAGREDAFTSWGFGQGLKTLAFIARHEDDRDDVRALLVKHTQHPKQRVQIAAIEALGELGDERAIAIVESFNVGPDGDRVKRAAVAALEKLNQQTKASTDVRELRNEVADLKKSNDELQKQFAELKAMFEARSKPVAAQNAPKEAQPAAVGAAGADE